LWWRGETSATVVLLRVPRIGTIQSEQGFLVDTMTSVFSLAYTEEIAEEE